MEDSGGRKGEYEAAFCAEASHVSTAAESEASVSMDETPKGDNPVVFTATAEEMEKFHTREQLSRIRNFNGMSLEDLYVIEICAGSARLSKAAHQCGFRTMAVDHTTARTCGFPICVFDLTDADDLAHLLEFLEESADSILAIWIAPSCGTCSRAREKRLREFEAAGIKTPIPLRSKEKPDQLDGLSGLDKIKVEKANMLYDAVYTLASLACALNIFVGIENPTNSHYWSTSPMAKLCNEQQYHYVTFHNCAHGGDRDKSTSLWVNDNWLDSLAILCDRQHAHKPWTTKASNGTIRFATAEEAAYPTLLCERIVHCLRDKGIEFGASSPDTIAEQATTSDASKLSRLVMGALPRGHKVKPLVAEFGTYVLVFTDPQRPSDLDKYINTLPKGSKVVARHVLTWGEFQSMHANNNTAVLLQVTPNAAVEKVNVGVPSDPDAFIERAIAAGHPRSLDQFLDPQIESTIRENFVEEPATLAAKRVAFFKKYLKRAKELKGEEDKLRSAMPPHVLALVGNKRLAL